MIAILFIVVIVLAVLMVEARRTERAADEAEGRPQTKRKDVAVSDKTRLAVTALSTLFLVLVTATAAVVLLAMAAGASF